MREKELIPKLKYGLSKKKLNLIYELEKVDKRFEVVKENNPFQFLLKFQDETSLKNRINLKNKMILELNYLPGYVTIYQPFAPGEKGELVLTRFKYKEMKNIKQFINEIDKIINKIELFYI
ncbi:MAG: hypothetical protein ACRDDH_20310 [Cetobacterium sp.]|uniref:hypothetical protein n=1 Tax=Cetobacterium sp. TaxID=2071632 RepID=UPI003EE626B1